MDLITLKIFLDSPVSWQLGFQNPATPVMEGIIWLHNYIICFLIVVVVVVFWFLGRSLYLFRDSVSKFPKEFNHDPVIETIWTVAPAFILIAIAIPSFSLLYSMDEIIKPSITLKVIGHQWYWSYEINDVARFDNLFDYIPKRQPHKKLDFTDQNDWDNRVRLAEQIDPSMERIDFGITAIRDDMLYIRLATSVVRFDYAITKVNLSWVSQAEQSRLPNYDKASAMACTPLQSYNIRNNLVPLNIYSCLRPLSFAQTRLGLVKWVGPSIRFDSYMIPVSDLQPSQLRLLEVDNRLILPIKTNIKVLVTSTDVIHSWAVPSFGVKVDAIPGRLNQVPLYIKRIGMFYGQCSELCGVNHAFMPICVQAVDYQMFAHWIKMNSNPANLDDLLNSSWDIEIRRYNRKRH